MRHSDSTFAPTVLVHLAPLYLGLRVSGEMSKLIVPDQVNADRPPWTLVDPYDDGRQLAALLGLLMLHAHLSGLQWLTILCIMLAAAGSSVTARRDRLKSAPAEVLM